MRSDLCSRESLRRDTLGKIQSLVSTPYLSRYRMVNLDNQYRNLQMVLFRVIDLNPLHLDQCIHTLWSVQGSFRRRYHRFHMLHNKSLLVVRHHHYTLGNRIGMQNSNNFLIQFRYLSNHLPHHFRHRVRNEMANIHPHRIHPVDLQKEVLVFQGH